MDRDDERHIEEADLPGNPEEPRNPGPPPTPPPEPPPKPREEPARERDESD